MRLGAKLPNSGPLPAELGIPAMARTIEAAGFDSMWVSDHIVMPAEMASPYPFAADGRPTWPMTMPWVDALVALSLAAAVTDRAELGTAVLVLPLRHPVEFAKQAASIDAVSGGRLRLGVGAGWLREEFDALGSPFERRGKRLVEWMAIARDCWTGRPAARDSADYVLPPDVLCLPTPVGPMPFLVGGHSPVALRRAGGIGDGWLAQQSALALDPDELRVGIAAMHAAADQAGRPRDELKVILRVVESAGRSDAVARALAALADAGVGEVVVDLDWSAGDAAADLARLRDGAGIA